jgi:amidase
MHERTTEEPSAGDVAARVRSGRSSAVNAVRDCLSRIDALDPALRAFERVRRDEAVAEAEAIDARSDLDSLPLAGVPVAVKDNIAVAGVPCRLGSRATPAVAASSDDELVARLRRAGAVVVGVTRMPELAIWPFTEFERGESVVNPRVAALTSGGSSGGAAVAVATGMALLAVGSDGGGSLRVPAACCGVVGFKPSRGVVPPAGGVREHWRGLTEWGPLASSVADAALLLDVLAGEEAYRHFAPPDAPLRFGVSVKPAMPGARVKDDVRDTVLAVADALRRAGHDVREADPPYPRDLGPRFSRRWLAGIAEDARGFDPALLEDRTRRMARAGRALGRLHLAADAPDEKVAGRMLRYFEDVDVLLTPTVADAHVPAGRWHGKGWIRTTVGVGNWLLTTPWNLVGFPAVSVPGGVGADGAPIGVQLVAASGRDDLVLAAASAVEQLCR